MHINISRPVLSQALNTVTSVVASKSASPVLQNVKVQAKDGQAIFICTDLDTTLKATVPCEVSEEGSTTIPARLFATAVSKVIDSSVDISSDPTDVVRITAGSSRFRFNGISSGTFPEIKEESGSTITIEAQKLYEMLRKTAFAMCPDSTRAALEVVHLDFSIDDLIVAVGTDGRRLSMLQCTKEGGKDFNGKFSVPRKAVDILMKKLPKDGNCEIVSYGNQLKFSTDGLDIYTKLVILPYANYRQVLPQEEAKKVIVNRSDFIGAIDRISIFVQEEKSMLLQFGSGVLKLSSQDSENGSSKDEITIRYEGEPMESRFNPKYLRDVLSVMDEDEVEMGLLSPNKPLIIRKPGSSDYIYVVMPLRIS